MKRHHHKARKESWQRPWLRNLQAYFLAFLCILSHTPLCTVQRLFPSSCIRPFYLAEGLFFSLLFALFPAAYGKGSFQSRDSTAFLNCVGIFSDEQGSRPRRTFSCFFLSVYVLCTCALSFALHSLARICFSPEFFCQDRRLVGLSEFLSFQRSGLFPQTQLLP